MVPLVAALAIAASPIRVERDLHYAPGSEQVLDAYVAPNARRAVVLIHGGGFHSGSKESLDPTALRFAQSGWTAFSISYRLVPPAPWYAAKEDVLAAVRWVRAHSAEFGFDPARLAVFGTSAGGNLAALAATVGRGRSLVAAAASWSGPMDLGSFAPFRDGPLRHATPADLAAHDPTRLARADAPLLRRSDVRFFLSSGPGHGRITKAATVRFARVPAHAAAAVPPRAAARQAQRVGAAARRRPSLGRGAASSVESAA